jgi:hypothetical protein
MPVDFEDSRDPRSRLVREKYFCLRPQPLERWLWSKRVASSAERVFWLHWQEGMQRGDWCSEIPLRRVARECHLDVSTVTRAYQILIRLGCLRRTDPGRDPANPFQQATAVTEIRLPRDLLLELHRHPSRRPTIEVSPQSPQTSRAGESTPASPPPGRSTSPIAPDSPIASESPTPSNSPGYSDSPSPDLFPGLTGRERLRAISRLLDPLSVTERAAYQEALRMHHSRMTFDPHSQLSADAQAKILQLLASLAARASRPVPSLCNPAPAPSPRAPQPQVPRKLSLFDLGHLRREIQTATSRADASELLREVVWSVEAGSLRRFATRHALHIALKKIREGLWTRPHRMPPNWARALSHLPPPETCGHA